MQPTEQARSAAWRPRLRTQLVVAFAVLFVLLAAIVTVTLGRARQVQAATSEAVEVTGGRSTAASEVAIAALLCRRYEKDLFLNIDDAPSRASYLEKWRAALAELRQAIGRYEALARTDAQRQRAADWRAASDDYERAVLGVERQIAAGALTTPQAANAALAPSKGAIRTLTDTSHEQAAEDRRLLTEANGDLVGMVGRAIQILVVAGAAALLLTVALAITLPPRILRPVAALQSAAARLAEGELGVRADVSRGDELGDLARGFNRMADQIQRQMAELDQRAVVEQQNAQLRALLDLVSDLEAPAIPLLDGVLLVPLVGNLDMRRVAAIERRVVEAVHAQRARVVILDLTGIAAIDTSVAQGLDRVLAAAALLGASAVVSGISAEVAQTASGLGVRFGGARVAARVQEALALAAAR